LTDALTTFAKAQQITVNTVTQGVWALVLARYSGSDDVCFGVTMATRPTELPGVENILG